MNPAARVFGHPVPATFPQIEPIPFTPPESLPIRIGKIFLTIAVFLSGHSVLKLGGLNLTVADVALLIAAVLFLNQRRVNLAPFGAMTPLWLLGLATMLGALFVSSMINGDPIRWLNIASQYAVGLLLVPVILMAVETRFAQRLILVYVIGIVVSQIIGISASFLFTPKDTAFLSPGFLAGNGRVGAMAGEPNPNGATIGFAFAMLIYCARKKMIRPVLTVAFAAILLWGLLLSASVTGFAASLLAVIAVLALTGLGRLLKVAFVAVLAGSLYIASGAPLPQIFEKRVAAAIKSGNLNEAGTFKHRAELVSEAWDTAGENIFYGLGADEYREFSAYGQPVHNLQLLIWNEGGAPAYVGLLLLLSLLVIFALAGLRERRDEAAMALAVICVFLIYTMSIPHMYSRFWILPPILALSTIYGRRSPMLLPIRLVPEEASART